MCIFAPLNYQQPRTITAEISYSSSAGGEPGNRHMALIGQATP